MAFADLSSTSVKTSKLMRFEASREASRAQKKKRTRTPKTKVITPKDPGLVNLDEVAAEPFDIDTSLRVFRLTPKKTLKPGERKWLHDEVRKLVLSLRPPAALLNEFVAAAARRFNVTEELVWPAVDNLRQYMSTTSRLHDYQCSQIVAGVLGVDRSRVFAKVGELLDAQKPQVITVFSNEDGSPSPIPTPFDRIGYQTIEYVPDVATQMKATQMGVALFGGQSPQTVQHQHGLDADLQNVTEEALKLEAAGLMLELSKLGLDASSLANLGVSLPGAPLTIETKTEDVRS
jgi:hypothetical protein